MFAITPLSVIQDTRLHASDYRVLLGLLTFADRQTLECFPKRETLATRIGLSVTRVQQVLSRLADLGWIERTRTGRATTYRITPPGGHHSASTAPLQATEAPTPLFLSDSKAGVSIASIRRTDHLSDQLPPSPLLDDSATTAPQERQQAAAARQQEREAQRQAERERERQERQERHQRREERRIARRMEREATPPGSHQEAVQRVLSVFRDVCNVAYPSNGAIAGKVANAIEQHGEETLTRVIKHRGASFRFPLALLRDDLIESISAEIERPAPTDQARPGDQARERRIYGVPLSEIERQARPGESYDDCALRLYEQRRNSTMRA